MESSAVHQEPEPGAPGQSSGLGGADVAGTGQDGGQMAAPARMGAGAEPEPEAPLDPEATLAEPEAEPAEPEYPERRRMGPLAVIVTLVAIAVVAAAVFAVVTHAFKPKTKVAYQLPAVFKLKPGDCFNSGQNDLAVTVLPCASSHDSEVFATFPLTEKSWPGNAAIQAQAQAGCTGRIAGYMDPELAATAFDQEYVYPDQLAWQAGVRSVICEVRSTDGPLTGSVRQSS
jgi:hypothetical protein